MVKILLINGVNIDGATGAQLPGLPPTLNNSAQGRLHTHIIHQNARHDELITHMKYLNNICNIFQDIKLLD